MYYKVNICFVIPIYHYCTDIYYTVQKDILYCTVLSLYRLLTVVIHFLYITVWSIAITN